MTKPVPIMFMSDSPCLRTGLGRICRDLATHVSSLPEFRVASFGRAGHGSVSLPWTQYNYSESEQFGEHVIQYAWENFSRGQKGIIMTIWDPVRVHWFARPQQLPDDLQMFLTSSQFKRWGYFPIDAASVGGRLCTIGADSLAGYDRILAYGIFGAKVLEDTFGKPFQWLPHGYNPKIFYPRGREAGRVAMQLSQECPLIGVSMSNQARKDWGMAFQIFSLLKQKIEGAKFWANVDVLERYWSIPALVNDFNLDRDIKVTLGSMLTDTELAHFYSACDITMLPSLGEGFGYNLIESMACGVPVIHINYAGGAEQVPREWLVDPFGVRLDGKFNEVRPVSDPEAWVRKIMEILDCQVPAEECVRQVEHLQWTNLWTSCWKKFFLEGI